MKMKILVASILFFPSLCVADPRTNPPGRGDRWKFEVPATAPAMPALKYQLTVDATRRQPGDAAALYLQATLLLPMDSADLIDAALDAHAAGTSLAGDPKVLDLLQRCKPVFDVLNVAAAREHCDWNSPLQELGLRTMLPQLNRMRQLANLVRVRALQQIDSGKMDDAIRSIGIEYAMAGHTASGGPLVSGLVGLGIAGVGHDLVAVLMARSDCPNLYWPLLNLPHPIISLRDSIDGERRWLVLQMSVLGKGKTGGITGDDWPIYTKQFTEFKSAAVYLVDHPAPVLDQLAMGIGSISQASKYYAQAHHLAGDEVSKIDSRLVLATYFLEQYQIAADEQSKILALPIDQAIERCAKLPVRLKELGIDDSNVAAELIPSLIRIPITFGRAERHVAALIAIEALRADAAQHSGALPAKFEDIVQTPVPVNPMTGKMFDYRVENGTATVSDTTSPGSDEKGYPLVYTLRIVKP